jgi:hypothetical protein
MARSVGQSARVLKREMKGIKHDEATTDTTTDPTAALPADQPAPADR